MHPWLSVYVSAGLGLLVFACATGTSSFTGTGLDEGDPDGSSTIVPRSDASTPPKADAAEPVDARVAAPDTGPPAVDSGPPAVDSGPPTGSGDCVGQYSAQLMSSFDDVCDDRYFDEISNPCTPGGNACAALDTSTVKFCCYKPLAESYCEEDYLGAAQCLPK